MLIDVKKLPYLLQANKGCPKSQYIMADHYKNGIGMPRNRGKAKYYYKLLASHDPKDLTFMETCYGSLLVLIAYLHYNDREDEEATTYFKLAASYYRNNFHPLEAEAKIREANIEKYLTSIAL